ncbi:MAG: hypothetical protein M1820_001771 [Bogoriella megaspora]|nr:MAG: hypothetical protein M1820_001771 [Bogoriella megaspora]
MAEDYSKLTVANLKGILKERGIPSTGLTRKQQIIDKLLEKDSASQADKHEDHPAEQADAQDSNEPETSTTQAISEIREEPAPEEEPTILEGQNAKAAEDAEIAKVSAVPEKVTDEPSSGLLHHAPIEPMETEETSTNSSTLPTEISSEPAQPDLFGKDGNQQVPASSAPQPPSNGAVSRSQSQDTDTNIEENRKRKRRSASPPADPEAIAIKKRKQGEEGSAVHLREDEDSTVTVRNEAVAEEQALQETSMEDAPADSVPPTATSDDVMEPGEPTDAVGDAEASNEALGEAATNLEQQTEPETHHLETVSAPIITTSDAPISPERRRPSNPSRDNRYRDLFSGPAAASHQDRDILALEDEPSDTTPAVHPATSALYIRELMRPLRAGDLREHLVALSTPPNAESENDDSIIDLFHLDTIRTHCFVKFQSVKEASRVRSALHNRTWPAERTRKPLWVDFVPEEKVDDWIRMEEDAAIGSGRGGKRWEVTYEEGKDGATEAVFQEVGPGGSAAPRNAPLGPRASFAETRHGSIAQAPASPVTTREQSKPFQTLDQLFTSTTAKPKLYYLPVSKDLVDKRLDEFDSLTSKEAPTQAGRFDEMRRFTFEDGDVLVDAGPEYRPRGGRGRGGFRGGPRGGPRGGFGGPRYGDSYRGDSYRNDPPRGGYGLDRR